MSRVTPILLLFACAFATTAAEAGPELTKSRVLAIVKDAMPDIESCGADRETVKVRFTIDTAGAATKIKVEGKHDKDEIGRCLKRRVASLRFGPNLKPTPVTFPFKIGETVAANAKPRDNKELVELFKILQSDVAKCGDGVARTKFTIKANGRVSGVEVVDADEKTQQCIEMRITRVRFPAAARSTKIDHAFKLEG